MDEIRFDKFVKIRKEHKCVKCNHTFPPGTEMRCITSAKDALETVYICKDCNRLEEHSTDTEWRIPAELSINRFKGTPEEYLELKRAERRKQQEL